MRLSFATAGGGAEGHVKEPKAAQASKEAELVRECEYPERTSKAAHMQLASRP